MSRWWYEIDHVEKWEPGISSVSSPGHGGVRVARGYASKNLSTAARNHATHVDVNYFYYEEDCDASIPIYELPHLWPVIYNRYFLEEGNSKQILKSLEKWNQRYLDDVAKENKDSAVKAISEVKKNAAPTSLLLDHARIRLTHGREWLNKAMLEKEENMKTLSTRRALANYEEVLENMLQYLEQHYQKEQEKKNNG